MSVSLASGIHSLAGKIAAAIPEAVGGFLFRKAVDLVNGGSDFQHLQASLNQVFNELKDIRSSINNLSTEILDFRVQVKTDIVQIYVNNIDSEYSRIVDVLNKFTSILSKSSWQETDIKEIEKAQNRLNELLEDVADRVGPWLDQIHSFLCTQKEDIRLITLATTKARQMSPDFLSYYCRVRIFLMEYYVVEARAIAILQMAVEAPDVNFTEGPDTIRRAYAYLEEQDTTFRNAVGPSVVDLAEHVLRTDDDVPITFRGRDNRCIYVGMFGPQGYPDFYQKEGVLQEVLDNTNGKDRWFIQRIEPLNGSIPNGGYTFRLRTEQNGRYLNMTTEGTRTIENMNHGGWRINHTVFPGKYTLRYTDHEPLNHTYRDLYMYIDLKPTSPGYEKLLGSQRKALESDTGFLFSIGSR